MKMKNLQTSKKGMNKQIWVYICLVTELVILFFIAVCILYVPSCSFASREPERQYPDYFTGEYVSEHYKLADMNLIFLQSYNTYTAPINFSGYECEFMEIKGVPLEQLIAVTSKRFMSARRFHVLYYSDVSVNPLYDFEIDRVELYIRKNFSGSFKDFSKYGKVIYDKHLFEIDDSSVMREILDSIRKQNGVEDVIPKVFRLKGNDVAIRIHFKEYENIVWDSYIMCQDKKYFLFVPQIYDSLDGEKYAISRDIASSYVYIGPQFDALMESLFAADL